MNDEQKIKVTCSFCKASEDDRAFIVKAEPTLAICDRCVMDCIDLIKGGIERRRKELKKCITFAVGGTADESVENTGGK